ncbi:hypothetical protein KY332_02360 [Candidatus Woesearchaeota archaeon]|nr:hypothetical protein [Candidatus Woesearchaeota archaeon]
MALSIEQLTLYVILGTLAAIVYSFRYLILLERKVARMEENIGKMTKKILKEEVMIEKMEKKILKKKR